MIDDRVLRELKKKAAAEGTTVQALANEMLRQGLRAKRPGGFKLVLRGHRADLQPGVDLFDRDTLFDLMNGR